MRRATGAVVFAKRQRLNLLRTANGPLARQLLALGASRVGAAELAARTAGFTRSAVASCGQRAALAALRRALSRAQLFEDAVSYM